MNFDEKVLLGGIECYLRLIERLNQSQVLREERSNDQRD
ncbi:N-acetyl-L,L-diaminopimelate deacetylase [Enterococcus sp. HSIEG1]|nr:N-acetyl-L,L-diaminopimelate deacetylase [Enterococcus sp. HSIEG1]